MLETEIQPLVSLVRSGCQVVQLLLVGHGIPFHRPLLVAPHIVRLGEQVEHNVHARNGEQILVAALVQRRVVCSVDVGRYDGAGLHKHIVGRGRDGAQADRVGIARVPADLDRVGVGIRQQHGGNGIDGPLVRLGRVAFVQPDQKGQRPDLADHCRERQLVPDLGNVREQQHHDDVADGVGNGEQVGLERVEAEALERERQVLCWRCHGDLEHQAKNVQRPNRAAVRGMCQKV